MSKPAFLTSRYSLKSDAQALHAKKECDRIAYDQHACPLPALKIGSSVSVQLPWSPVMCTGKNGPRSYWIRVNGRRYQHNQKFIRTWNGSSSAEEADDTLQELQPSEDVPTEPPAASDSCDQIPILATRNQ